MKDTLNKVKNFAHNREYVLNKEHFMKRLELLFKEIYTEKLILEAFLVEKDMWMEYQAFKRKM